MSGDYRQHPKLPGRCKFCQHSKLVKHCENGRCGWWRCAECESFGEMNGTRAVNSKGRRP